MTIFECLSETHECNERKRAAAKANTGRKLNLSEYDECRGAWLWTFGVIAVVLLAAAVVVINLIVRAI